MLCVHFQTKQTTWTFLAQIYRKMDLWLEILKINIRIRMIILKILCVPILRQIEQLPLFWAKFVQKWMLGFEFQKSKRGFGINTSKIPCVLIFRQNRVLWIFPPKFWGISKLHVIFWLWQCRGCSKEISETWNKLRGCESTV